MKDQSKTPGAMVLDRELINRIAKQRTPADWGAAIDELRAILSANPEDNSPCPECGGSLSTWGCTCTPRWPMHRPTAHIEEARAMVEQTPAVGTTAERIRQAMIADSSQEGVNIAEGRFGKAMAALCVQLDGQTPAVGGEPRTFSAKEIDFDNGFVECVLAADHRAYVAPLLADIERLKHRNGMFGLELSNEVERRIKAESRIAELEAQIVDLKINVALAVDYSGTLEDQIAKANDWAHLNPDMDPQKP